MTVSPVVLWPVAFGGALLAAPYAVDADLAPPSEPTGALE